MMLINDAGKMGNQLVDRSAKDKPQEALESRRKIMPEISEFSKVAPYLHNPLVLVGFILFLCSGIFWAIIKSPLLAQLSQRQSSRVVHRVLNLFFLTAIICLVVGFVDDFYGRHETSHKQVPPVIQQSGDCSVNVNGDNNSGQTVNCDKKDKK